MNIKVFDCTDEGGYVVALPETRPGRLQLVFVEGEEQRVIEVPASWRRELAMKLLEADGARVSVKCSYPRKRTK